MLGWAQMLRQGRLDSAATIRALEAIERSAKAQAQLVDDLLDVSRIIRGELRLNLRPVSLNSAIAAAVDTVRAVAVADEVIRDLIDEMRQSR